MVARSWWEGERVQWRWKCPGAPQAVRHERTCAPGIPGVGIHQQEPETGLQSILVGQWSLQRDSQAEMNEGMRTARPPPSGTSLSREQEPSPKSEPTDKVPQPPPLPRDRSQLRLLPLQPRIHSNKPSSSSPGTRAAAPSLRSPPPASPAVTLSLTASPAWREGPVVSCTPNCESVRNKWLRSSAPCPGAMCWLSL